MGTQNIKAQVHLVATDKMEHNGLQILKHNSFLRLPITGAEGRRLVAKGLIPQHLYFTTDEEIKEDDPILYLIHVREPKTFHGLPILAKYNPAVHLHKKDCVKIIATTNPELSFNAGQKHIGQVPPHERFPIIDTPFIEAYIKSYNEGNPIKEVLLEQIDNGEGDWTGDNYTGEPFWNSKWELKLRPNGSVIVHPTVKSKSDLINEALEIIKRECEKADVRKYLNLNNCGFSQIERNIAERIINLGNPVKERMFTMREMVDFAIWLTNYSQQHIVNQYNHYVLGDDAVKPKEYDFS